MSTLVTDDECSCCSKRFGSIFLWVETERGALRVPVHIDELIIEAPERKAQASQAPARETQDVERGRVLVEYKLVGSCGIYDSSYDAALA